MSKNWIVAFQLQPSITPRQATVGLARRCSTHSHLWGKGVEAPTFYITGQIHGSKVNIYQKRNNTIKFNIDGVEFLKFRASEEEVEIFSQNKLMDVKMIVTLELNEWRGRVAAQGLIEEYKISIAEQKELNNSNNWKDLF